MCALAHEESACGRFLKEAGKVDKTRAGKMMTATGKTLNYSAQQRIQLRTPLVRLYQDVETFQYRAITDTYITIDKMEKARTAYRGALLWMKDMSQQLDPDTYKQLEKFRKVQSHVRRSKMRFDKIKVDTLQKVDMLSASRCNLFSHALAGYQAAWLNFWEKTSRTMNLVADSFKGYQYYEFNMLKELTETSRKLADEATSEENQKFEEIFGDDDKDRLIFFDAEYRDDDNAEKSLKAMETKSSAASKESRPKDEATTSEAQLLDLDKSANIPERSSKDSANKVKLQDLLTSFEPDEVTLLNEIFNKTDEIAAPTNHSSLGATHSSLAPNKSSFDSFLPSQILDKAFGSLSLNKSQKAPTSASGGATSSKSSSKKEDAAATWLNLFSELDPLANPDAIGQKTGDDDRNC